MSAGTEKRTALINTNRIGRWPAKKTGPALAREPGRGSFMRNYKHDQHSARRGQPQ
jgi:hypothetical protein